MLDVSAPALVSLTLDRLNPLCNAAPAERMTYARLESLIVQGTTYHKALKHVPVGTLDSRDELRQSDRFGYSGDWTVKSVGTYLQTSQECLGSK